MGLVVVRVHECKTICHVRTGGRNKQRETKKKEEKEKEKEKLRRSAWEKKMKISAEIFSESLLIFAHDKFPDDYTATFILDSSTH